VNGSLTATTANTISLTGGTGTAVSLISGASGTINVGNTSQSESINVGSTALATGTQTIDVGYTTTAGGTTNVNIGSTIAGTVSIQGSSTVTINAPTEQFTALSAGTRNINVAAQGTNVAGTNLTIQAGAAGTGAAAFTGGTLTLEGGNAAGTGNANGANVLLQGGAGDGTGVQGLVTQAATAFNSVTYSTGISATITQADIDDYSTVEAIASAASLTLTVPSPTITTAGRIIYISNAGATNAFTVAAAGLTSVTLNTANTATLLWDGAAWTEADISSGGSNYIQNQNATQQTANFDINGIGQAAGFDADTAGVLNVGITTATSLQIGSTTNTTGGVTVSTAAGYTVSGVATSAFSEGNNITTGTITIGGAAQTGSITLGSSTGSNSSVLIANGSGSTTVTVANGTAGNTVNINNGAGTNTTKIGTAASANSITIGSVTGASSLVLDAGTGNLQLQDTGGTLGVGNSAVAQSLVIGNSTGATSVSITSGTGNVALSTGTSTGNISLTTDNASSSIVAKSTVNTATAFVVQNSTGSQILGINSTTGQTDLGNNSVSPIAGSIVLANGSNGTPATVTINANGSETSNFTITLPTNGASGGLCLESSTASTSSATTLQFNSCANNSPTISVDTINTWPKSGTATSGTTATISAFTPSTDGDLLLVTTSIPTSGGSVKTSPVGISDSDVTSWTRAGFSAASGSALRVEMWYGVVTGTTSAALTVTYTGTITSGTAEVDVTEFTAVGVNSATTWGVDNAGGTTGTATSGTPINMYNGTPGNSGELYYGFANDQSAGLGSGGSCPNVPSVGTTWTCTTSAGGQGNVVDYDLNTTAGTVGGYNGQIYLGATSYNYSSFAALFLAFVNSTAINNAVSTQEANFDVQAGSPGSVAGVLESNGTGDSLDLQNNAGVVASSFNSTGSLTVGNTSTSAQTASAVAFATPTVTYTVPNGYYTAVGQTITVATCSGTGADSGAFVVTAVTATTIAVSNTLGVASETGCVVTTGSDGIINLEDENTNGTASGVVSLQAGIPSGSSYNYSLILPNTAPNAGLCLETSSSSANQLVFNSCASNNPSISLQTTVGFGNNEWDTHAGTVGTVTTLLTYPEEKGDLEVMSTQIPNGTSNGVTVSSVSGGGVTLWHKAAVDSGNTNVNRVEVWYGTVTGISPKNYASQTVSSTTYGSPNLTYTVPSGQPFITGEYITVTGCSGTNADNGSYPVASFTTSTIVVSTLTGVAGETGCTVNAGWTLNVTYTPSTPGAATEVSASEFTAVGVAPTSSWGIDTSGNSLITSASTSLSGPSLTASTSGELYYSYANEQTSTTSPEGYATCSGTPAYNCLATGQNNVIVYNDQTILSNAYQSAWTVSPTALDSNTVGVLFEAFISSTAINNATSVQEANFDVQAATSGSVAGVLQANAAGTADILDLYNGGGTKEFTVSNTGLTTIGDSATISLIQSAWANATVTGGTTAGSAGTTTLPAGNWSNSQTKGDVVTLGIQCASATPTVAEITGGNVSNWNFVANQVANSYDTEIWEGTIATTASAATINVTFDLTASGWSANCEVAGQEFSASVPSGVTPVWSVTSTNSTTTGTATTAVPTPTMAATQYGELYWSYDVTQHAATEPALQAPYFYQLTGDSKTIVYDTSFSPGTVVPPSTITQTSGTYNDISMVLSASTGSNLTDNGGAIFTGSDAQTDLQVIGASGSGAAVLNADTLNDRVNVDGTLTILSSPVLATPTASGSGSALTASQYCYEVTAIDGAGDETTPSNEKCITPTLGQDVSFTWGAVAGAISYRVYRTIAGGASGSETFLYDATQLTFTDIGAYNASGLIFPPSFTTAYGNSTVVNSGTAGTALTTGIENNLQLTVGGNGSPTGQVYVSGTLPSGPLGTATIGGSGQPIGLAVQGNYAYISFDATDKFAIYDVTNPANPVLVGQANTLAAPWFLSVSGHYVYVTDKSPSNALQIFDVSNPASPELISTFTTDIDNPSTVFMSGNYAYITNASSTTQGLEIVNVSNPYAPALASVIAAGPTPWNVFVQGRYAYVVQGGPSGGTNMYVFDISNPNQPILDSTFSVSGYVSQIYVSGSYAYLSTGNNIQIINIVNPYNLSNADTLATTTGGEDCTNTSASYLEGHYLYIACYGSGTLEQVDVTNPYSPVITGTVAVGASGSEPQTVWVQGRYAYVDAQTGYTLSVFDLGGIYSSSVQAGGLETGTLGVDSNALIGGTLSVGAGFTVGGSANVNGSVNAYGGANIAGNVILGASTGLPVPTSPTVTATCASSCTTFYFYGVSATDPTSGSTLMSQPGGPAPVNGVPPVDYVNNVAEASLSDTTNYNTIPITPDLGTSDTITSYSVYACHETTLSVTPPAVTPCSSSTSSYLVATIATASATANTAASATFASPTLTYTTALTASEVKYQKVTVTGCSSGGDNGTFVVTSTGANTIAVYDTSGVAIGSGAGCSIVGTLTAEDYGGEAGTTGVAPTTTTAENSSTAFQVNNAASVSILTVNTSAGEVIIGAGAGGSGSTTPALLLLDDKSSAGDPTEVNGAMYYNASTGNLRCGVVGTWENCGGLLASNSAVSTVNSCTTNCLPFSNNASLAANYCTPGRVITITMGGVYNTTTALTLSLGVYWGTNATTKGSDTLIGVASPNFTTATTSTNLPWSLNYQINCLDSTHAIGSGIANFGASTSTITPEWMNTSTSTGITTTSAENVYIFPAIGTNLAGDSMTADTISITGE
jgi:hypothetical protein